MQLKQTTRKSIREKTSRRLRSLTRMQMHMTDYRHVANQIEHLALTATA